MVLTEMFRNVLQPIKNCIKKDERVVVLTDTLVDLDIVNSVTAAVWAAGAEPTIITIPAPKQSEDLPRTAAAALLEADLMIAVTFRPLSRTRAIQNARDHGVKYFAMGGITKEALLDGGITEDYDRLYEVSTKFAEIMDKGNTVHITSEAGTDLRFSIKNRRVLSLDGRLDEVSKSAGVPTGEVACSPEEGTAEGVAVIDGAIHELGLLAEPIVMKISGGRVVEMHGGQAAQLQALLEACGDENSFNIAEFAFGTNSQAKAVDNVQEYKNKLGTIHLALGNNINLFGSVRSRTHLDAIMKKPTVKVDGVLIIDNGKPVIL